MVKKVKHHSTERSLVVAVVTGTADSYCSNTATAAIQPLHKYSYRSNTATAAIQLLQKYSYCSNTATAGIQLPQQYSHAFRDVSLRFL